MAEVKKASRRYGTGTRVLTYMTTNADRPVTIEELNKATGDLVQSIPTAITRLMDVYPNLRKTGRGVYFWDSTVNPNGKVADNTPPTEMIIEIKGRRDDGTMLAMDDNGGLWKMSKVEW